MDAATQHQVKTPEEAGEFVPMLDLQMRYKDAA